MLAGRRATIAIEAAVAASRRDALQQALEGSEPAVAFLSLLTAAGMRDLPVFAYAGQEEAGVRVLLRGNVRAVTRAPSGAETELSGRSVSTWAETVQDRCSDVSFFDEDDRIVAVVVLGPPPPPAVEPVAVSDDAVVMGVQPAPEVGPADDALPSPVSNTSDQEQAAGASGELAHLTRLPDPEPDDLAEPEGTLDEPTAVQSVVGEAVEEADEVDLAHLFETRHVGVEAAAMRSEEPSAPSSASAGLADLPPPSGPPVSVTPPPTGPPAAASFPPPTGAPISAPPPPGLIAGVPGGAGASPPDDPALHDGLTISGAQLAALRGDASSGGPASAPVGAGPQLQAVACPAGHLNPPQADQCRACGAAVVDRGIRVVARPTLGHLAFDTGMVADIDRPLLVGRKPTVDGLGSGAEVPSLVVLPDPDGALSRVHVEVRLEGWEVLVVDRGSTNGTTVEVPGQPPVLLRPNEPFLISPGSRITLADVVSCTFKTGPR